MFGIGLFELIIIGVVALVFIGPEQLPKFIKTLASLIGQFRKASDEIRNTILSPSQEAELRSMLSGEYSSSKSSEKLSNNVANTQSKELSTDIFDDKKSVDSSINIDVAAYDTSKSNNNHTQGANK